MGGVNVFKSLIILLIICAVMYIGGFINGKFYERKYPKHLR